MHLITNAWGSCILSEDSKFVCLAVFQLRCYIGSKINSLPLL